MRCPGSSECGWVSSDPVRGPILPIPHRLNTLWRPFLHRHLQSKPIVVEKQLAIVPKSNCWFAADVVAAMLVNKSKALSSAGNCTLLSRKFCEIFFHCFVPQHGRLATWLQTKNTTPKQAQYLFHYFLDPSWQIRTCNCLDWGQAPNQLGPVVSRLDYAIQWINHYQVDKFRQNKLRYPLDTSSDLSSESPYLSFEHSW